MSTGRVCSGRLLGGRLHWSRLREDAKRLGVKFLSEDDFHKRLATLIPSSFSGVVSISWERAGENGAPWVLRRRLRSFKAWPYRLRVAIAKVSVPPDPALLGVKPSDRSRYRLADQERRSRGFDELLLTDRQQVCVEGTISNLIWREGEIWYASPARRLGGVEGLALRTLVRQAEKSNNKLQWSTPTCARLKVASGVWLVNAVRGAGPVGELSGETVMTDESGTRLLASWLRELCG